MTFVLEIFKGDDSETHSFKTLAGATRAGERLLNRLGHPVVGYLHANRLEGPDNNRRRVVAEWKDRGQLLAEVWT